MTNPLDEFIDFVAPDLKVTEKHGMHDQSSHGRGGSGGKMSDVSKPDTRLASPAAGKRSYDARGGADPARKVDTAKLRPGYRNAENARQDVLKSPDRKARAEYYKDNAGVQMVQREVKRKYLKPGGMDKALPGRKRIEHDKAKYDWVRDTITVPTDRGNEKLRVDRAENGDEIGLTLLGS